MPLCKMPISSSWFFSGCGRHHIHGILVHDSLASYWQYGSGHGLCCAHILRELNGVAETHPEQTWAPSFIKLLLDMKRAKDEAVNCRREWLDAKTRNEFSRRYGQILRRAYQENPPPSASTGTEAGASAAAFLR